jgi:hypothetical protein
VSADADHYPIVKMRHVEWMMTGNGSNKATSESAYDPATPDVLIPHPRRASFPNA